MELARNSKWLVKDYGFLCKMGMYYIEKMGIHGKKNMPHNMLNNFNKAKNMSYNAWEETKTVPNIVRF